MRIVATRSLGALRKAVLSIPTLDAATLIAAFLVPGLVASFVRVQFTTGRLPSASDAALSYLALSLIYYALIFPLAAQVVAMPRLGLASVWAWFGLVFIGPALLGLTLGLNARHGWIRSLLRRFGCSPVHHIQSAWDWRFNREAAYVLIRLTDGTQVAGLYSNASFVSSSPDERDIYLQRTYDLTKDGEWIRRSNTVLVASSQIVSIEFWPYHGDEECPTNQKSSLASSALIRT